MWELLFTKQAAKDAKKIKNSNLKNKTLVLLEILKTDPFANPPPYKELVGDLKGTYSRRINIQHRLVYEVFEEKKIIRVLRMWTHYE